MNNGLVEKHYRQLHDIRSRLWNLTVCKLYNGSRSINKIFATTRDRIIFDVEKWHESGNFYQKFHFVFFYEFIIDYYFIFIFCFHFQFLIQFRSIFVSINCSSNC